MHLPSPTSSIDRKPFNSGLNEERESTPMGDASQQCIDQMAPPRRMNGGCGLLGPRQSTAPSSSPPLACPPASMIPSAPSPSHQKLPRAPRRCSRTPTPCPSAAPRPGQAPAPAILIRLDAPSMVCNGRQRTVAGSVEGWPGIGGFKIIAPTATQSSPPKVSCAPEPVQFVFHSFGSFLATPLFYYPFVALRPVLLSSDRLDPGLFLPNICSS